jgi:hypothetical protein
MADLRALQRQFWVERLRQAPSPALHAGAVSEALFGSTCAQMVNEKRCASLVRIRIAQPR